MSRAPRPVFVAWLRAIVPVSFCSEVALMVGTAVAVPAADLFPAEFDDVVDLRRAVGDAHMREMVIDNVIDLDVPDGHPPEARPGGLRRSRVAFHTADPDDHARPEERP